MEYDWPVFCQENIERSHWSVVAGIDRKAGLLALQVKLLHQVELLKRADWSTRSRKPALFTVTLRPEVCSETTCVDIIL